MFCAIVGCAAFSKGEPDFRLLSRSVVKIMAISQSGTQNLGSGVVIDHDKIATNCHVTRAAVRAYLLKESQLHAVRAEAALPEFDVCILETGTVTLPAVPLANPDTVVPGDQITIIGYPLALGIKMKKGSVIRLHPHADDEIIEISAGFKQGASGGGVFNDNGELIGLMTFMGRHDKQVHYYAVPVTWLARVLEQTFVPMRTFSERSFWEKGDFEHRPEP